MDETIVDKLSEVLMKNDIDALSDIYEKIFSLIAEAIFTGSIKQAVKLFNNFYSCIEKFEECIEADDTINKYVILYYGEVRSIIELLYEMDEKIDENELLNLLEDKYKYLNQCINIVGKYSKISGVDLQKSLHMKNSSNLSNFMKRIEPYKIFNVQKVGNTKYYSLSPMGKRSFRESISSSEATKNYSEKFVISLLNNIGESLENDDRNVYNVLLKTNLEIGGPDESSNELMLSAIRKVYNARKFKFIKNKDKSYQEYLINPRKYIDVEYSCY